MGDTRVHGPRPCRVQASRRSSCHLTPRSGWTYNLELRSTPGPTGERVCMYGSNTLPLRSDLNKTSRRPDELLAAGLLSAWDVVALDRMCPRTRGPVQRRFDAGSRVRKASPAQLPIAPHHPSTEKARNKRARDVQERKSDNKKSPPRYLPVRARQPRRREPCPLHMSTIRDRLTPWTAARGTRSKTRASAIKSEQSYCRSVQVE